MKRKFFAIALAALTVGLLGSCSKINERLDSLEKEVGSIKNEEIASVKQQISAIDKSISDLGDIRNDIQALKNTTDAQKKELENQKKADEALGEDVSDLQEAIGELEEWIEDLEAADIALGERIDNLKAFVSDTLSAYATTEWVSATLATLEQNMATCDDLAAVDAKVGALDTKLGQSIDTLKTSLKGWVNTQMDAYYTAAQMDTALGVLQARLDTTGTANREAIALLATDLASTKASVDTAKSAIRTEYKAAITSAIQTSEGKLTKALQDSIANVNGTIKTLTKSVSELQDRVTALEGDVKALKEMIQTVTIVPAYSDGSVEAIGGILTVNCIVEPAAAVAGIKRDSVRVLVATVNQTKASSLYETVVPAEISKTPATGELTVKADISSITPATGKALMVALKLTNGISKYTTGFVGVTEKALPEGALKGMFSVASGKKVQFSQGNLIATIDASGVPTAWRFATNQYDYIGNATANTSIGTTAGDVDLFCWSTVATYSNWGIHTKTTATTGYTDADFNDWGTAVDNNGTWRTLTTSEWQYLFNYGSGVNATREGLYAYGVKVMGKNNCVILYPDGFAGTKVNNGDTTSYDTAEEWTVAQNAGVVCLPAAGLRTGSSVNGVGDGGNYWSSDYYDGSNAYLANSSNASVIPSLPYGRESGCSVRLVTEVED